jgi:hypothetical protein
MSMIASGLLERSVKQDLDKGGHVRTFIRACRVLACLVVSMAASLAGAEEKAAAPMIIYDTALQSGWENWSWAKTELSLEVGGSARKPIKVEAGPWQALYLHHEPVSTAGYSRLQLLIQGSAPDGQVRILALVNGKPVGDGHLLKLGNTGWTKVGTPLAELGVEDQAIDGIWVQNASAAALPKFYVTEIRLE